jgi:Flp pilus assembly protein TadG
VGGLRRDESGAAIVDFALVAALVTVLFLGVVQLAVVLHVRNTLIDCASEGARYGALADRSPEQGSARTRELIESALAPGYATDVTAGSAEVAGLRTVEVTVRAPMPVIGLLGPRGTLVVQGHGVEESR